MESTVIVISDGEEDIEESELNVVISNDIKIEEEECDIVDVINPEREEGDISDVINPERVDLPPCSDSPSCSQKIDGDACNDGESVLNILLNKPKEHSLPKKTSAIRTGKIFTLNSKIISIGSMKADDNGPYIYILPR